MVECRGRADWINWRHLHRVIRAKVERRGRVDWINWRHLRGGHRGHRLEGMGEPD
jgi:hypothetical protein